MTDTGLRIDVEALTREFDAFCRDNPGHKVMGWITEREQEHFLRVIEKRGRFVSQFEATYEILVHVAGHVNFGAERREWPGHRAVQFVMTVENLKPIYSAFGRLVRGYYEDSFALMRIAYEAFFRIVHVSLYPEDSYWSFGPKAKGVKQFQLTNFLKDELRLDWTEYKVLSSMAHSYEMTVLRQVVQIGKEGQKEPLGFGFAYDETTLSVGVNVLRFLLLLYLHVVIRVLLQPRISGVPDQGLVSKAKKCIELYQKDLLSHPDEYWRRAAQDLDFIFHIIERAEEGEDWKSFVREVRPEIRH